MSDPGIEPVAEKGNLEAGSLKLSEMSNQFMETVNQLKARAPASRSKDAMGDSPHLLPPKQKKRMLDFTPPRNARDIVKATQDDEDMELDSLCSHSSRIPRKRLLQFACSVEIGGF